MFDKHKYPLIPHPHLIVLAFLILLLSSTQSLADNTKKVTLKVGQQYSISANHISKYSEGQKGIIAVRLPEDAKEFIIVGLRAGNTTLLLIEESGQKLHYKFEVKAKENQIVHKENIRLDFYFVELKRGGQEQMGLAWPSSISADLDLDIGFDTGGLTGASATLSGLPLPRLDVLHANHWARITRQATIISANGEEAEFQSGGEVNIAIQGSLAAELRKIPYGTKVKVLPRFDKESGRLEIKIDAEVSSLGEGQVPSKTKSMISTLVNVEMNQAIVLAGLHARGQSKSKVGLPFLSQIPVLGTLFGTHGNREEEVQNVVFIVPSIVDVVAMDARTKVQEALKAYDHYQGQTSSQPLFPTPPLGKE